MNYKKAFGLAAFAGVVSLFNPAEASPAQAPQASTCPVNIHPKDMKRIQEIYPPAAKAVNAAIDTNKLPNAKLDIDISAETAAAKLGALKPLYIDLAEKGFVSAKPIEDITKAYHAADGAQLAASFESKHKFPCTAPKTSAF